VFLVWHRPALVLWPSRPPLMPSLTRTSTAPAHCPPPGCGELSDQTDCACNIHPFGGHLLCHDDVIGNRRVSYIIYLTGAATIGAVWMHVQAHCWAQLRG